MFFHFIRGAVLCLCCAAPLASYAAPIRTSDEWAAMLASNQATPLDALTPYGKREFIARIRWGQNGLGSFSSAPLVRELNAEQLAAVLELIGATDELPMLTRRLVGPPLRLAEPSPDMQRRLLQLQEFTDDADDAKSVTALASALPQRYDELFRDVVRSPALARQRSEDLPLLFTAAGNASLLAPGSAAYADMLAIHAEFVRRGIDTRRDIDGMTLNAMLAARAFEPARAFAASHPALQARQIPTVVDPLGAGFQGRSVFQYDAASNTLTRQALPAASGKELIMVVDSGCHFSRDALAALHQDRQWAEQLRAANLILITTPSSAIDFNFVTHWNRHNPRIPMLIPYNEQEWRALNVTDVPRFYWFRNATQIAQVAGWPAGGGKHAVLDLIAQ